MNTTHTRGRVNARAALHPLEHLILTQFGDLAGPNGVTGPSVRRLAEMANVADATVRRALQRPVELLLIARTATHTGLNAPLAHRLIGGRA